MPGTRKGNDKSDNNKPQDVKNEHPSTDDGHSACPPNDGDCTDQQAALISADVQASALGLDVCLSVDVGGGLDLPGLDLPDCLSNLDVV